jgi:YVTN family beta-propeller protein
MNFGALILKRKAIAFAALCALGSCAQPAEAAATASCPLNWPSPFFVQIRSSASKILFDDACRFIYMSAKDKGTVEVFSIDTRQVVSSIPVGIEPSDMDFSPDGSLLYVSNRQSKDIAVVDVVARKKVNTIAVPTSGLFPEGPGSIAVARDGRVFFTAGDRMMSMPAGGGVPVHRTDYSTADSRQVLVASGDRSVIAIGETGLSSGRVARYLAASDTFSDLGRLEGYASLRSPNFSYIYDVAINENGERAIFSTSFGIGYVLNLKDAHGSLVATLPQSDFSTYGIAINSEGSTAYQVVEETNEGIVGYAGLEVLNVAAETRPRHLISFRGDRSFFSKTLGLSKDASLAALSTNSGISIIEVDPAIARTVELAVPKNPVTGELDSYFRFYNGGSQPGTVHVRLRNLKTRELIFDWRSPVVAPGTTSQFAVAQVEPPNITPSRRPAEYLATVYSQFPGAISHVAWDRASRQFYNLTSCSGSPVGTYQDMLLNVHSSLLDGAFQSYVVINSTGRTAARAILALHDAGSGSLLGSYEIELPSNASRMLPVSELERGAGVTPREGGFHYIVTLGKEFSGFIQHIVVDARTGVLSDFSTVCKVL